MAEESFEITSEEIQPRNSKHLGGWQVILKMTNKHGVGISGKVYARIGLTEVISQLVGVLPDQTKIVEFTHSAGPITKIYTDDLICSHTSEHIFSFEINDPVNGKIYAQTVKP